MVFLACTEPNPNAGDSDESESSSSESASAGSESGTEGGSGGECTDTQDTMCDGECVDLQTDDLHCGDCNEACADLQVCEAGECVSACAEGQEVCGDLCVDLQSDDAHCGACDVACGTSWGCTAGACVDERSWGTPLRVDDSDTIDSTGHQLALTSDGLAFVAFEENEGPGKVFVSEHAPSDSQWDEPIQMDILISGPTSGVGLAVDSADDVIFIWHDEITVPDQVCARRRAQLTGMWDDEQCFGSGEVTQPRVMTGSSGSALIAWKRPSPSAVRAIRWNATTESWGAPESIAEPPLNVIGSTPLALAAFEDNFSVLWFESDQTINGLYESHSTDTPWSPSQLLTGFDNHFKLDYTLHMDSAGDSLAVWTENDGGDGQRELYANHRSGTETTWAAPKKAELIDNVGDVSGLRVFRKGNVAAAVWDQDNETLRRVFYAPVDVSTGDWGPVFSVEDDMSQDDYAANLHIDEEGNIVVVWFHDIFDGNVGEIRSRQFHAASNSWGESQQVAMADGGAQDLQLAQDTNDRLVLIWASEADATQIWSTVYE